MDAGWLVAIWLLMGVIAYYLIWRHPDTVKGGPLWIEMIIFGPLLLVFAIALHNEDMSGIDTVDETLAKAETMLVYADHELGD